MNVSSLAKSVLGNKKKKKLKTDGHFHDSSRLFSRQQVMVIQNPKSVDDRCKNEFIGSCARVLRYKKKKLKTDGHFHDSSRLFFKEASYCYSKPEICVYN